jgi:hypothetical protein
VWSKRSTNVAVLGELGRYPVLIEVFFTVIKYLNRKIKTEDTLLLEAFNVSHKTSLPYNTIGFTVGSNICKSVLTLGFNSLKLF